MTAHLPTAPKAEAAAGTPTSTNTQSTAAPGDFTDRQLATLRSAIQESVRAAIREEFDRLNNFDDAISQDLSPELKKKATDSHDKSDFREQDSPGAANTGEDYYTQRANTTNTRTSAYSAGHCAAIVSGTVQDVLHDVVNGHSEVSMQSKTGHHLRGFQWVKFQAQWVTERHSSFDAVMGVIIVANAICIGLETHFKLVHKNNDTPLFLVLLEYVFLACFVSELALRMVARGRENMKSGWFLFDLTLVAVSLFCTVILEPLIKANEDIPVLSQILTLRVLRLVRLVRWLSRLTATFQDLWRLCNGLIKSMRTMMSVLALVFIAVFVFACLGVDLISLSDALASNVDVQVIIDDNFSTLPLIMLTLLQFANADSIAGIYMPICKVQPMLTCYFLVVWLVMTVALMNLVTAVIVETAMTLEREDSEERQNEIRRNLKRIMPKIETVFHVLDSDGSGRLGIEELDAAAQSGKIMMPSEIRELVEPKKLKDVFTLLDTDGSGCIDKMEFVEGICSMALASVPIETTQILHLARTNHELLVETKRAVQSTSRADRLLAMHGAAGGRPQANGDDAILNERAKIEWAGRKFIGLTLPPEM